MDADSDDIRDALARVLASETFANSPTLSAFLRYVTEETLAGRADRLKAYSIAVSALERPEDFNPNDNALVRVQARRLRDALARYYVGEGSNDPLRIALPVGTYVPTFETVNSAPGDPDERQAADGGDSAGEPRAGQAPLPRAHAPDKGRPALPLRPRTLAILIAVTVLLGMAAYGGWYYRANYTLEAHRSRLAMLAPETVSGTGLDARQVLPVLLVSVEEDKTLPPWFDADLYRQRIEVFAQRFDDLVIVRHALAPDQIDPLQPAYRMAFTFTEKDGSLNGLLQLSSLTRGRLIAAEPFTLSQDMMQLYTPGSLFQTPADLKIVRDIVQTYGVIFGDVVKRSTINAPLACLTRAYTVTINTTREGHLAARRCLEKTIAENPHLVPAYTLLATMYLAEYRQKLNPLPGDPLERAEAAIKRATQISPTSSGPYQTLQNLLLIKGDTEAAVVAGRRAVELNPEDMEAVGAYGSVLARVGRHLEAANNLLRAAANLRAIPRWLHFYTFLALNNLGRAGSADRQTPPLVGTQDPLFLTAIAISAHRRGDETAARTALDAIFAAEPSFRTDPLAALRRRGLSDAVANMLLYDLNAAGLGVVPKT